MWQKKPKKESKVQKMARQQGEQKKEVKFHAGCGGELTRVRHGGTLKMVDFCGKCHSFLPKES